MPVDPLHLRRVPSGRRAGAVLASLLRAMLAASRAAVLRGRVPDLGQYAPEVAREVMPLLLHEYTLGRHQILREVRRVRGAVPRGVLSERGFARTAHRPVALRVKAAPGLTIDFGLFRLEVPAAVARLVLDLAGGVTDTLREAVRAELAAGLEAGDPLGDIAGRLAPHFAPRRAYLVAATESSRAMHAGEADAAKEMGAAGLEWLASSDACDGCRAIDGRRVRFGEPFAVLKTGNPAYRTVYHAPLHPACMCSCTVWFDEDERGIRRA